MIYLLTMIYKYMIYKRKNNFGHIQAVVVEAMGAAERHC
jgi:hypothetical protein